VSTDEARQLYEVRAAIEAKAGYYFAQRASDGEIEDLRDALRAFERSAGTTGVAAYVEALDQFYGVLLRGSRNEVAARILRTLWARINYLRAMTAEREDDDRRRETTRLLWEIVDLAAAREPAKLARKCEAFVDRSAAFAIAVLRDPEDSEDRVT
jgi:DNA-binding GntR family transcriptional regulator